MTSEKRRPISRNYAKFNFRVLQLLGVWNPYRSGLSYWLYKFYMCIVFTVPVIIYTCMEIVDAIIVKDDLQLLTENMCLTMTHLAGISKIINLWIRKPKIYTILDILERELRQKKEERIEALQKRANWRADTLSKACGLLIISTLTMSMMLPILDKSYKESKFPYRFYFPMNTNQSTAYWSAFLFVGLSVIQHNLIIVSHDTLLMVFMIHVVAHISILKMKVQALCKKSEFWNSTSSASEERPDDEWIAELNSCVKSHQAIIRLVSELQGTFSVVILLQFLTSLVIIGLTGFQVTASTSNGRLLHMLGYLICVLFELLVYCWFGNEIILESENLRFAAYSCDWFRSDQRFCRTLTIFMSRTQKPLVIMAGNFCDLSLETFGLILNRSYSYVAVLNKMNE